MAKINDWKPEVGMEVLIVPNDTRYPGTKGKIEKVARKYFYIGRSRFYIDTKAEDNGDYSSWSHVYRTESDYNRIVELRNKRRVIERNIRKLTDEQVDQVYEWITPNIPF